MIVYRDFSIDKANKLIDNLESLPVQVKEKIFNILNTDSNLYVIEEDSLVVQNIYRCNA